MLKASRALVFLALAPLAFGAAPNYSLTSIVNSATGVAGEFAPNGMVSIYGTDLAYRTEAAQAGQITLPKSLAGVSVLIGGMSANLYYVSPTQINFLVPSILLPGSKTLAVIREGLSGPILTVVLKETAPGFFPMNDGAVIATHANGNLITSDAPAAPDEVIVIYAAGLGRTDPDADPGRAATRAAPILLLKEFAILLNGSTVAASRILYAGITPGFAGLYQINLKVPTDIGENPEIRAFIGVQGSPSYLKLPVKLSSTIQ